MYVTLLRGIRKLWRGTGRAGMLKLISNPGDELVKDILPKITQKKKSLCRITHLHHCDSSVLQQRGNETLSHIVLFFEIITAFTHSRTWH